MLEQPSFQLACANPKNVFTFKKARITLCTSRLARFEWADDAKFEDRQTLAVINRDMGTVKATVSKKGNVTTLKTADMTIVYTDDAKPFSRKNLSVDIHTTGVSTTWYPGKKDTKNLKGTARTLDGCLGDEFHHDNLNNPAQPLEFCDGVISRSGWAVIEDTKNLVFDKLPGHPKEKWVAVRSNVPRNDFYLFAYGHDYVAAIHDAAELFGSQPLPPRFTLGYWYCRYWNYCDTDFESLADHFDSSATPIDVMCIDMDWHTEGWTGYSWDKRYFPNPEEFLHNLHDRGLKTTMNLHPADGVAKHEDAFPAMCKAMGLDPKKTDKVPFNIADPKYVKNYFEILHHPLEKQGVDFWWMDWQQGRESGIPGLDPLPWINSLHWNDMQKRKDGRRPLILSRFGGVGAGRYVIGFSGDTYSQWKSLAFQPYFTATAANILYGYWSHDIGGHMPGVIEPELYARWIQFGLFAPILRTHTTKNYAADRRFWNYPEPYSSLMRDSIIRRYELVPYIYTENARCVKTGVSLCHPVYYAAPEEENAYKYTGEYMFGSSLLVSPVVSPVDKKTNTAEKKTWLPAGEWFDTVRGRLVKGNSIVTDHYMLSEIPVFAKAGAIIPEQRDAKRLLPGAYAKLAITVYPGKTGEYDLYEDDGVSRDYQQGICATTRFSHAKKGKTRVITAKLVSNNMKGFNPKRSLQVVLPGVIPPSKVCVNGVELPWSFRMKEKACWQYNGQKVEIVINAGVVDTKKGAVIEITYPEKDEFGPAQGLRGAFTRLAEVGAIHNSLNLWSSVDPIYRLGQELGHTGRRIAYNPASFKTEIQNIKAKIGDLPAAIRKEARDSKEDGRIERAEIAVALLKDVQLP